MREIKCTTSRCCCEERVQLNNGAAQKSLVREELSFSLKTTSMFWKPNDWDFSCWWESCNIWYLQQSRTGRREQKCPHCCIVSPLKGPVVASPHSSAIDLQAEALTCIFSTPPLLIVINGYIFLMFFYLWLQRPSAKLFFYSAFHFYDQACLTLSRCAGQ